MSLAVCDECGQVTGLNTQVKTLAPGIEETYFKCSHCRAHFTAFVMDKDCRRWQREVRKTKNKQKQEKIMNKLGKRMDQLKAEYISNPDRDSEAKKPEKPNKR